MKFNFKRVSKIKQRLIQEVMGVWLLHLQDDGKDAFIEQIYKLGWSGNKLHGFGSFKNTIWKNNIIAKFAYNENQACSVELERELEQFNTAPSALKKYLPNTYILKNGLMIQDRVVLKCDQVSNCNVEDIAKKLNLRDYNHNHAHNFAGTIKFFDWVWRRIDPWLGNPDKPLKDA